MKIGKEYLSFADAFPMNSGWAKYREELRSIGHDVRILLVSDTSKGAVEDKNREVGVFVVNPKNVSKVSKVLGVAILPKKKVWAITKFDNNEWKWRTRYGTFANKADAVIKLKSLKRVE